MTHREDVARRREIAGRWRALAQQRLEHLTEMFETGRWRRFHSEPAFLENMQEAKRAVQIWSALAEGGQVPASTWTAKASPAWSAKPLSRGPASREFPPSVQPNAAVNKAAANKAAINKAVVNMAAVTKTASIAAETPVAAKVAAKVAASSNPPQASRADAQGSAPKATGKAAQAWSPRTLSRSHVLPEFAHSVQPNVVTTKAANTVAETSAPARLAAVPGKPRQKSHAELGPYAEFVVPDEAPPAPPAEPRVVEFTLKLDGIEARYPLLRNAF